MSIEHKDITEPDLHDVKGAAAAAAGQLLVADGAGSTAFTTVNYSTLQTGWWTYDDVTTAGAPIPLTLAATWYNLTNDGAGPNTNIAYGLNGYTNIWNTGTNRLDLSGLAIGDTFDIRVNVMWTTGAANTNVEMEIQFGVGSGSEFSIPITSTKGVKTAGALSFSEYTSIFVGSTLVTNYPAIIRAKADATGSSIVVDGWYVRAFANG